MLVSLLNLIFPFCLLLTKNSLAGAWIYARITGEKKSLISYSFCYCVWAPAWCRALEIYVLRTECFNRQLSGRLALPVALPWTSPRIEIIVFYQQHLYSQHLQNPLSVRMNLFVREVADMSKKVQIKILSCIILTLTTTNVMPAVLFSQIISIVAYAVLMQ